MTCNRLYVWCIGFIVLIVVYIGLFYLNYCHANQELLSLYEKKIGYFVKDMEIKRGDIRVLSIDTNWIGGLRIGSAWDQNNKILRFDNMGKVICFVGPGKNGKDTVPGNVDINDIRLSEMQNKADKLVTEDMGHNDYKCSRRRYNADHGVFIYEYNERINGRAVVVNDIKVEINCDGKVVGYDAELDELGPVAKDRYDIETVKSLCINHIRINCGNVDGNIKFVSMDIYYDSINNNSKHDGVYLVPYGKLLYKVQLNNKETCDYTIVVELNSGFIYNSFVSRH